MDGSFQFPGIKNSDWNVFVITNSSRKRQSWLDVLKKGNEQISKGFLALNVRILPKNLCTTGKSSEAIRWS
jgi:hypothetical protein